MCHGCVWDRRERGGFVHERVHEWMQMMLMMLMQLAMKLMPE